MSNVKRKQRKNVNESIVKATRENIEKLEDYCDFFDNGKIHYAQDMAKSLYILLNDEGKNCKSLLGLLGSKQRIRFYTMVPDKRKYTPIGFGSHMVGIKLGNEVKCPFVSNTTLEIFRNKMYGFKDWWREKIAYEQIGALDVKKRNKVNYFVSREDLIMSVRSQENGSHFDTHISPSLYKLKTNFPLIINRENNSITFSLVSDKETKIKSKEFDELFDQYPLYMIRAITYEFLESVKKFGL
jgi:hypothetical protein